MLLTVGAQSAAARLRHSRFGMVPVHHPDAGGVPLGRRHRHRRPPPGAVHQPLHRHHPAAALRRHHDQAHRHHLHRGHVDRTQRGHPDFLLHHRGSGLSGTFPLRPDETEFTLQDPRSVVRMIKDRSCRLGISHRSKEINKSDKNIPSSQSDDRTKTNRHHQVPGFPGAFSVTG